MKQKHRGFTIVELVIAIAVIAILAAVLIPSFSGVVGKAQRSADMSEAQTVWTELMVAADSTPERVWRYANNSWSTVGEAYSKYAASADMRITTATYRGSAEYAVERKWIPVLSNDGLSLTDTYVYLGTYGGYIVYSGTDFLMLN